MIKAKKTKAMIVVALILFLILAAIIFPLTPGQAVLKKQLSICGNFGLSYMPASVTYCVKADSDLYLYLSSVRRAEHGLEIYPLLATREGLIWRAFCPDTEAGFHSLFPSSDNKARNEIFTVGNSCVGQVGHYTVIFLGDSYLRNQDVDVDDVFDSLGSSPFILSKDCLDLEENEGNWVSFSSGRAMSALLGGLKGTSYVFVIRDLPDDYKLTIGEQVLTKTQLLEQG